MISDEIIEEGRAIAEMVGVAGVGREVLGGLLRISRDSETLENLRAETRGRKDGYVNILILLDKGRSRPL